MYVCLRVVCQIQCECDKVTCSYYGWRQSFESTTTMGLSQPGFVSLHFPFSTSDLPLSCLSCRPPPPTRSLHWPYKNVRFLFIWWNEIQFLNALRCCAARTSLQLQFLGAARDIDIFISQYICMYKLRLQRDYKSPDRTALHRIAWCRQRSTSERKLFNTYLNFVVCCIRKLIYSSIQSKWINIANKVSLRGWCTLKTTME